MPTPFGAISSRPATPHAPPRPGRGRAPRALAALVAVLAAAVLLVVATPTAASAAPTSTVAPPDAQLLWMLNEQRAHHGLAPLQVNPVLADQARAWSAEMARRGQLAHHPNLSAQATAADPSWTRAAENVGASFSVPALHWAFGASPRHLANNLGPYRSVGVGVVQSGGQLWATVRFLA
jgi:uncharacterized protein YkwD